MRMLRRLGILLVAALLGAGAAIGVAACGEDREGDVQFEDGSGTSSTTGTATAGETAPETETTEGAETETSEGAETESEETETESEDSNSGSGSGGDAP